MLDVYAGRDPRNLPAYAIKEAAHYLHLPRSTLYSWVCGRSYPLTSGRGFFQPVINITKSKHAILSFTNLVEAHVLAAVRREHNVSLAHVRTAIEHVRTRLGVERPLAHVDFETDGIDLFVRQMGALINASQEGQVAMRNILHAHLQRVERDEHGLATRLFPFTRTVYEPETPKLIVIDPRVSFGRAVITGTGIPTVLLAERYRAGESFASLANDYRLDAELVEEAIRCELRAAA